MKQSLITPPAKLKEIQVRCTELGFEMASDIQAGALLRSLVSSKPGGHFLELGTGIGASLCWMLDGMHQESKVISIDDDNTLYNAVQELLGEHSGLTLLCQDGGEWIQSNQNERFDLIFADTWPGKYYFLEETLAMLNPGGFYVIDDMLPADDWPEGHEAKATALIETLTQRKDLQVTMLEWSTGLLICTKQ